MRGFNEEGTTTTPFDMVVRNELDRFSLARDVIDRVSVPAATVTEVRRLVQELHAEHVRYIHEHGDDMPLVKDWTWGSYSK